MSIYQNSSNVIICYFLSKLITKLIFFIFLFFGNLGSFENFTEEKQYEMFADHVYKEEAFEIEEWLTQLEANEHE